jgi:uncharacterized protein (TIGR03435 family)
MGGHQLKIEGGPPWVNTSLYQIDAKAGGVTDPAILDGPMMQSLLEERFQLKLHRETREIPVYALVVGRGGPKVPPAKVACFAPGSGRATWRPGIDTPPPFCDIGKRTQNGLEVHGATMANFCIAARRTVPVDRIIVDRTGVAGQFDFDLTWPNEDAAAPREGASVAAMWMSRSFDRMQSALGRLGLRLVDAGPGEFIVIDHVERPTPN